MIAKDLIENRINNFWGYGNLNSNVWFIGMEEGFHGSLLGLENRFNKTKNKSVIDLQDGMVDVKDHMRWFSEKSSSQPTWRKLILILLFLEDKKINNDKIKKYQKEKFGRLKSNHCSLEFMPLPCRSVGKADWFYDKFGIDYLVNRKSYIEKIMPTRIKLFKKLIEKYKPKIVIFYSLSYLKEWKKIIGSDVKKVGDVYFKKSNNTNFFIIPHSTAYGKTNNDWTKIAKTIKKISI